MDRLWMFQFQYAVRPCQPHTTIQFLFPSRVLVAGLWCLSSISLYQFLHVDDCGNAFSQGMKLSCEPPTGIDHDPVIKRDTKSKTIRNSPSRYTVKSHATTPHNLLHTREITNHLQSQTMAGMSTASFFTDESATVRKPATTQSGRMRRNRHANQSR